MKIQKTLIVISAVGFLSMGNKACNDPAQTSRELKMEVEVSSLKARPVKMPTGEIIDFPYVANTLFYRQIINHDHFVILNSIPSPASYSSSGGIFKTQDPKVSKTADAAEDGVVSPTDLALVKSYGFYDQATSPMLGAEDNKSTAQAANESIPACLYDMPQAYLGGEVISFEATWGVGLGVGYGPNGDLTGSAAGNVQFDQTKLEVGLRTDDPLTQQVDTIGDGIAKQSKIKLGVNFGSGIPVGLNFFFNTPITDVIRNALTDGLDNIVDRYKTMKSTNRGWNEVWESRVVFDPEIVNNDTHVLIRGGYRAGVQVGDTFTVTNMHYVWEGAACYTKAKYKIPTTTTPVAEMQVVTVGDNVSVALITKYFVEQKIKPGAMVKVLNLKEPVEATKTK